MPMPCCDSPERRAGPEDTVAKQAYGRQAAAGAFAHRPDGAPVQASAAAGAQANEALDRYLGEMKAELALQLQGLETRLIARLDGEKEHRELLGEEVRKRIEKATAPARTVANQNVANQSAYQSSSGNQSIANQLLGTMGPFSFGNDMDDSGDRDDNAVNSAAGPTVKEAKQTPVIRGRTQVFQQREALLAMHRAQGWTIKKAHDVKLPAVVKEWQNLFNGISVFAILLNAAVIGWETDTRIKISIGRQLYAEGNGPWIDDMSQEQRILTQAAGFITFAWLCVEVSVSFWGQGYEFFNGPEWKWNAFDGSVLVATVMEMLMEIMEQDMISLAVFRVLRLARIARCVRMFRVLKFLRRVRSMLIAMGGSMVSLAWAVLLMLMIMFSVSIVLLQGLANNLDGEQEEAIRRLQWTSMSTTDLDDGVFFWHMNFTKMQQLQTLYGGLGRSIFTCFRAVIGEMDYFTAVYAMCEINWTFAAIFVLFTVAMIFGVLNVLTGIFCDAAMQAAQQDRDNMIQEKMQAKEDLVKSLTDLFSKGDADHSGYVTKAEFDQMMDNPSVMATLETMNITVSEAAGLFHLLDSGQDGTVDVHEFVSGCVRLKGDAKAVDMVTLIFENKKVLLKVDMLSKMIRCLVNGEPLPQPPQRLPLKEESTFIG